MPARHPQAEWLEADGLGGFASGTVSGIRTRRYHALLLVATNPPTGRFVLVNGFDAWVQTPAGTSAISSQAYTPDVIHPDGARRIDAFEGDPWPTWNIRLEDGTRIVQELMVAHDTPLVVVSWRLARPRKGVTLSVRPFLSGRDYHALHQENPDFRFDADQTDGRVTWRPYPGVPAIAAQTNGAYTHEPAWYRRFLYAEERARGLDDTEDLASPGAFRWDLSAGEAVWILTTEGSQDRLPGADTSVEAWTNALRRAERRRRRSFPSRLHRAADAYLVRRGRGKTIVAGYPWFTDWGRDTFIALRGLCLATGRLDEARTILLEWAHSLSDGMVPNRFPDRGETPEFNSVDASLWYVVAIHEFLHAMRSAKRRLSQVDQQTLTVAIESILEAYTTGTRYQIRCDADGLLAAGETGQQLTWMDAKAGEWVVTPRIGKPVEVQALWLNALWIASRFSPRWQELFRRGSASFRATFWNPSGGWLHDVVDCHHQRGSVDPTFRPNQILAVGGLPLVLLEPAQARRVVEAVEARLWTPMGLRSLAPGEPGYAGRYQGGVRERDAAYHQGTVWPWLTGPFVEAWVRVHGGTSKAKRQAHARFLQPLLTHLDEAGMGHLPEIADGDPPHTPRGCPFQAWSAAEVLRLRHGVLAPRSAARPRLLWQRHAVPVG